MANLKFDKEVTALHYKTARINDLDIFYREAGPQDAPSGRVIAEIIELPEGCSAGLYQRIAPISDSVPRNER